MNIPNTLVTIRLLLVPLIVIFLYIPLTRMVVPFLVILAWVTDFLDGYIARKRGLQTKFGAFYDQFVDKILVAFSLITLGDLGIIPMWLVILMLFRDYLVTGIRSMVKAEGVILKSEWSGKIKFGLQVITIIIASALFALAPYSSFIAQYMYVIVFWTMVVATLEAYYALVEFLAKNWKVISSWR
ncbi:CDP-diacylglycerol--glycerol-3-phosphate 3-phosphatidyltransferase [Candidatus Woesearchaeota archaeon]|nr:CDP-diacylglycerol--glycerol-3-phosphate 3-phosphatidyltransferase [Candidatus Woesearchaeota archaeon]